MSVWYLLISISNVICHSLKISYHHHVIVRSIRGLVLSTVYQSLVVALVLPWLDYGSATLSGFPTCLLNRFQSVLNAAARSIAGLRSSEHITDALASFRWLRAPERIKFKLAVIVYRALHGAATQYLSDQLQ